MSTTNPNIGHQGGSSWHANAYSAEVSQRSSMQLPPMSSLLPRHEQLEIDQDPRAYQYPQPQPNHPLHFSDQNPAAPVHHVYHPSQPSYAPNYRPQSVLVPAALPPPQSIRSPVQYEAPPAQQRQAKKISQRRDNPKADYGQVNSYSALDSRYAAPPIQPQPYGQEDQHGRHSISSRSMISPREGQNQSVPIAGLLSVQTSAPPQPTSKYSIRVRQQPHSARACGFGERDRRVVDPPPILILDVERPSNSFEASKTETYVMTVTLWDPELDKDASAMPLSTERKQQRRLMGSLVSSPFMGKDENNVDTCFFTFPDLSVRTPGTYSLRFSLVVMDIANMRPGFAAPVVATVKSSSFHVFNAKDFAGMQPSTALTKSLKAQGCLIPVKKGNSKTNVALARELNDDDDDEDDEHENSDGNDDSNPSKPSNSNETARSRRRNFL